MLFLLPFLLLPICFGQENPVNCTHPSFTCPNNSYCIPQLGFCQKKNQQNNKSIPLNASPSVPHPPSSQAQIKCGDKTCQKGEICVRLPMTNVAPAFPGGQQPPPPLPQQQQQCMVLNRQSCYNSQIGFGCQFSDLKFSFELEKGEGIVMFNFDNLVGCEDGEFCFYQIGNGQTPTTGYCVSLEDQQSTNCENQQQPNEQ